MFCPLQCGAAFQDDDVIVLNGTKEDVETLKGRMEERRLRAKLGKVAEPWGPPPSPESSAATCHLCGGRGRPRDCAVGAGFWAHSDGGAYGLYRPGLTGGGTAVLPSVTQLLHL